MSFCCGCLRFRDALHRCGTEPRAELMDGECCFGCGRRKRPKGPECRPCYNSDKAIASKPGSMEEGYDVLDRIAADRWFRRWDEVS